MFKRLFFFFLLCLWFFSGPFAYPDTNSPVDGRIVSPVYEEMLANLVHALRRELIRQKKIRAEKNFVVANLDDPHPLAEEAARNAVVVLVFTPESERAKWVSKLSDLGFEVHSELFLPELEFVQNDQGRQIVNLDDPKFVRPIFERLVREGMNPVNAHLAADQAIKDFRKLKKQKLLVFDRMHV